MNGFAPASMLPWDVSSAEDRLFRRGLALGLVLLFVLGGIVPLLPVEEIVIQDRDEPQVLARVVLEEKVIEKKVVPLPEPEPEPKPEPLKPEPPPEPVETTPEPVEPDPQALLAEARRNAEASGVLAFKDDLESLRDTVDVTELNQTQTSRGAASAQELQRSIITSNAVRESGGILTAELSRNTGGPALSGRETTKVSSNVAGTARKSTKSSASQQLGGRSDEDIRRIMDRNKGAIFAIYNRALRKDPLLEGKLVFEMLIDPNGRIVELNLLSSDLASDELTRKILARINLIDFGAAKVISTRVNYSFDFLPYT